jgi:integrase
VAALLASCDRSKPAGLRDFAMLCLLGRLELRSGEVAALRLEDIQHLTNEIRWRGVRLAEVPLGREALGGTLVKAGCNRGRR